MIFLSVYWHSGAGEQTRFPAPVMFHFFLIPITITAISKIILTASKIILQGNSIYFWGETEERSKRISRKSAGSRAALNISRFLLMRLYWAWETRFSAVLRKTLRFSGELSFLALEASSRKTTSRHQWSWFSIDQCFLTESANVSRFVSEVIKYLVNSRISPFSAIVDLAHPSAFSPFHSFFCSSHDKSVKSWYSLFSILPCPFSIVVFEGISAENALK